VRRPQEHANQNFEAAHDAPGPVRADAHRGTPDPRPRGPHPSYAPGRSPAPSNPFPNGACNNVNIVFPSPDSFHVHDHATSRRLKTNREVFVPKRCNKMALLSTQHKTVKETRVSGFLTPLSVCFRPQNLSDICGAWVGFGSGIGIGLGSHSSSHAPLLLATLLSHNIPLPRVH